jgi:hypothetical protein
MNILTLTAAAAASSQASAAAGGNDIFHVEFYVVEHWVSSAALAAHERTEAFIRFGRELVSHATLHDTVTRRPLDVN